MNETAPPTSKVVRLPRDWLGPHEELVPFGKRSAPSEPMPTPPESPPSPTSAEDFWGERSAAVHGVVQSPPYVEAPDPASVARPRRAARQFRLVPRRLAAASIAALGLALAIFLLSPGSDRHTAGARLNLATILSRGVSRIFTPGPPRIVSATAASPAHARPARHVSHRAPVTTPRPHTTQNHSSPPRPATTYAARAAAASAGPTNQPDVSASRSPPANPPPSSGASVSATGASGALGPVQSPNG